MILGKIIASAVVVFIVSYVLMSMIYGDDLDVNNPNHNPIFIIMGILLLTWIGSIFTIVSCVLIRIWR